MGAQCRSPRRARGARCPLASSTCPHPGPIGVSAVQFIGRARRGVTPVRELFLSLHDPSPNMRFIRGQRRRHVGRSQWEDQARPRRTDRLTTTDRGIALVAHDNKKPEVGGQRVIPGRRDRPTDAHGQGRHRCRVRDHGPGQRPQPLDRQPGHNLLSTALHTPAERANALLKSSFTALRRVTPTQRIGDIVAAAPVILTPGSVPS